MSSNVGLEYKPDHKLGVKMVTKRVWLPSLHPHQGEVQMDRKLAVGICAMRATLRVFQEKGRNFGASWIGVPKL